MFSLIRSVSLRNFKGFAEEIKIDLKPITLLFGANSAGKSSILHALQYVREILERNNANADRTLQGGDAVDLGGFLNLVHDRDRSKNIEIEIAMVLGEEPIPELVPEAFEDGQTNESDVWAFYDQLQQVRNRVMDVAVRFVIGWSELRETAFVSEYTISANGQWCMRIIATNDGRDAQMNINSQNPIFMVETEPVNMDMLADLLGFELPTEDATTTAEDGTKLASIWHDLTSVMEDYGIQRPGAGLRSWLKDSEFRGALPKLGQMLYIPTPDVKGASGIYIAREFTAFLSWLTIGPAMLLREQLQQMRYIGPLRRIPPRGFDVSLTKNDNAWSDGMAAWESLLAGSSTFVEECSDWMRSQQKLATGYGLERVEIQEMQLVNGLPHAVGPIRKRLYLVDNHELKHQPQDVGVGISQILPVVVAANDMHASIVCIEQPELHVHPSVQVGIGDLLIDGAMKNGLNFLIETHSEHLILRILRRIREFAESQQDSNLPEIRPQDVGIIYLGKNDGVVRVHNLIINESGDFDTPWPKGFFEERGEELF